MKELTYWDYCQCLLVSQTNFTQTYFGEHSESFSHDQLNRLLRNDKLTPRVLRDLIRNEVIVSPNGYVLFDDTVIDKRHSFAIEAVRRQWSGNAKKVIKGIGVVTCVYVNPDIDRFWAIDYRIYDPERDGRSKIDHLIEMFKTVLYVEQFSFRTVLMDSWYTTMKIMKMIEKAGKIYYGVIKSNRSVSELLPPTQSSDVSDELSNETVSSEEQSEKKPKYSYQRVDSLEWSENEQQQGKFVHLNKFPQGHQLKLFRLVLSSQRTDYVVTNDIAQDSTDDTRKESAVRWRIEQLHREAKQVTGLEACQCRKQRAQRNHIACAMLVWGRLTQVAHATQSNVYQLKQGLLDEYMRQQLRNPSIPMLPA